ncbi:unnamed protein product [Fusarium venenatum]|uniref:Uncharacterized protein n=1 Tax=Fusarium venenatum TaxID=56646 RepID=A0A2L2TE22_9HYPO|nr:LOW QUALITY PROTEIN: uncharacterized protein FVRRES_11298 [Fusarium venenatum]CEI38607.1 unnamed protein product [Fusarium venenatum]
MFHHRTSVDAASKDKDEDRRLPYMGGPDTQTISRQTEVQEKAAGITGNRSADLLQTIHNLVHQDALACQPCFQGLSVIRKLSIKHDKDGAHLDNEPLILAKFGSSAICLCLSKTIDILERGPECI